MPQRLATTDEVILAYPGAADLDPDVLQFWTDAAASMRDFAGSAWGDKGSYGHAMLTAHLIVANGIAAAEGGGTGPIGSVIARDFGELKEKYGPASVGGAGGQFGSTSFGSQFADIEASVLNFSAVAGGRTWWPLGGWI